MTESSIYRFTLVLTGVDDKTPELEDKLFEAGCDDALIHFRNRTVYLDFEREAASFEEAACSAIKAVEASSCGATVVSVGPDDIVSINDIAQRINQPRQTVSLWVKGKRLANLPFPHPTKKLGDKSPFWRWYDVVQWLIQQNKLTEQDADQAYCIENINAVLNARDQHAQEYRNRLEKRLHQRD